MPGHTGHCLPRNRSLRQHVLVASWRRPPCSRTGHLNPLIPKTYDVIKNVINDMSTLFPESFYHGGADEVVPADPTIQKHLTNNGVKSSKFSSTIHTLIFCHKTIDSVSGDHNYANMERRPE